MKEHIFNEIKNNPLESFLKIPSTMPKTFNRNKIKPYFQKDFAKKLDDISETSEFYDSEVFSDIFIKSETERKKEDIENVYENRQISIDLNNGDFFEQFFINRVDRDIFDLKYHSKISRPNETDYSILKEFDREKDSSNYLEEIKIFIEDIYTILKQKDLFKNLKCKPDFLIKNVKSEDIKNILNDPYKKYHVFGNDELFIEKTYELIGEITIDLFKPEIYINKVKQLLKYIVIIKLIEKNKEYFNDNEKKALIIVTNGKYLDFINKLAISKIYSNENLNDELDCSSIEKLIKNSKNFVQNIETYKKQIFDFKNNFGLSKKIITRDLSKFKEESNKIKQDYKKLEEHTMNFLKILKSSDIPFILCYFPKIGDELPYKLFNASQLSIEKIREKTFEVRYTFKSQINETIKNLQIENQTLQNNRQDLQKEIFEMKKQIRRIYFIFFIFFVIIFFAIIFFIIKNFNIL